MDDKLKNLRNAMDRTVLSGEHFTIQQKQKLRNSLNKQHQNKRVRDWFPKSLSYAVTAVLIVFIASIVTQNFFEKPDENTATITNKSNIDSRATEIQVTDSQIKTIQVYLGYEFTGPSEELKEALEHESPYPPELQAYLEENYKPLVVDLEKMVNTNLVLVWLRSAAANGYQLQPTSIEIEKINDIQNIAYNYKAKVKYSKDGQSNTATITGRINLNEEGKILSIREVQGFELLEEMGR